MATSEQLHYRARVASLTRSRTPDDPELIGARRDHAAAKVAHFLERTLAEAPPLTSEQLDRLAAILRGGAS